ncbi:hypothetical protein MASR1M50_22370 [Burkholderiales bacterium]
MRRLLENGANTSFVNRIGDASVPVAELVTDPVRGRAADRQRRKGAWARRTRAFPCPTTCLPAKAGRRAPTRRA